MPVNTISVGAAVTPTVIHTYLSHYLNRRPLAQKPTAHISYHEGLELIRRFLHYASFHTVEELQAFTSQWVPVPRWVHVKEVEISGAQLQCAAEYIHAQLGPEGLKAVGGKTWWQWRRQGTALKAEWIEMRKDHDARKQLNIAKGDRIMLYVHGGAYFFGSVDEHRYQMQRHARKLKARVLAPKYRLAPQFPFPCGLYDCLATYLYLLDEKHDPSTIILAGDSAGGGMVLSMLVTLRDQGLPLPAGAILISPWVDLTHSFPSLGGDGKMDYIPAHGFLHKPSMSWPPPNADDLLELARSSNHQDRQNSQTAQVTREERPMQKEAKAERVRGYSIQSTDQPSIEDESCAIKDGQESDVWVSQDGKYSIGPKSMLSVQLDAETRIEIKDQIQLYAPNHLLTHPLVSPALQPTLGGLPPLLVQTGGGELLSDEQIYIAHKAAQPPAYLPPPSNHQNADQIETQALKYRPTNVQLQVWDDLCHVCPTLSFTRPAKHMYRSIAQFGAWALARAQKKSIDILEDDEISFMSSDSSISSQTDKHKSTSSSDDDARATKAQNSSQATRATNLDGTKGEEVRVGKAGDPLPPFERHMIRQRIDRHGYIYALPPKEELVALNIPTIEVGVPKTGPVSKWMKAQAQWNNRFSKQKVRIQKQRIKDMQKGFEGFFNEAPPPTALAGRRVKGITKVEKRKKKSWGMAMWSGWGSQHDKATIVREEKADHENSDEVMDRPAMGGTAERKETHKRSHEVNLAAPLTNRSRSHSRHSVVTDQGQAGTSMLDLAPPIPGLAEATAIAPERKSSPLPSLTNESRSPGLQAPGIVVSSDPQSPPTLIPATESSTTRPTKGGIAYPFSLKVDRSAGHERNASTLTLQSMNMATPPAVDAAEQDKELGDDAPISDSANEQVLEKRPGVERYFTAAPGASLSPINATEETVGGAEKAERPSVERFETAREKLSTAVDEESRK